MLTFAYSILAGILAVGTLMYLMRTVQGWNSPSRHLFALSLTTQLMFGTATLLYFPVIETAIAQFSGIAPLSLWLANMSSLIAATSCFLFYRRLVFGRDLSMHRFVIALIITMLFMSGLLFCARNIVAPDGQPVVHFSFPLLAYRVLDILYLGYCVLRLMILWRKQFRVTKDIALVGGLTLFYIGGAISFVWLVLNIPLALTPLMAQESAMLEWWYSVAFTLMGCCFTMGSIVPLFEMRLSVVGSPWRAMVAYYRLQPLWIDLTNAVPQVVLPLTLHIYDSIWRRAELDLLLYRRVIEMLDAWRHLMIVINEDIPFTLASVERATWSSWARNDAQRTYQVLMAVVSASEVSMHLPLTYVDQVQYLEAVSQAYRRLKRQPVPCLSQPVSVLVKGNSL